ncbi:MAG: UbiX family flavin prenyltransferase [Halobacteriota archaeon]|nr:UbiX family flavin prenyltransferase [Halobacteriota archaeon]
MRIVVGITGASGAQYGVRLLEVLRDRSDVETHLIISDSGKEIIRLETDINIKTVYSMASHIYKNDDLAAPVSSGSYNFDGEIILPCSMKTLASIANGISDTLITRVADVCLKEGRLLVLMPRETPLSLIHCENLVRVKRAGAVILPASPAFYSRPTSISDLIDFMVGRVLDSLGIEHNLYKRWDGMGYFESEKR